jgi:large subunit ribosomal protein L25
MGTELLTVVRREEKGRKTRKQGFIPAVIYGGGIKGEPIKFDEGNFVKIINKRGERARIKILFDGSEKFCIIRDVNRDVMTKKVQHVDIQIVQEGEMVKWEIPIKFVGKENLASKRLVFEVELDKVDVTGEVEDIPEAIEFNVGKANKDEVITIADLNLPSEIKSIKSLDTVLGSIKFVQQKQEDNVEAEVEM